VSKPASPRAGDGGQVVEIDAIDVAEWESDQHTPQAPVAGLAALVRQTVRGRSQGEAAVARSPQLPAQPPAQSPAQPLPAVPPPAQPQVLLQRPSPPESKRLPPRAPSKPRAVREPQAHPIQMVPIAPAIATPSPMPAVIATPSPMPAVIATPSPMPAVIATPSPAVIATPSPMPAVTADVSPARGAPSAPPAMTHASRPGMVRLPLTAPASGPTRSPLGLLPMQVEPEALRRSPDHTPAPPSRSNDFDVSIEQEADPLPWLAGVRRFASGHVLVIAAAAFSVLITALVFVVLRGGPVTESLPTPPVAQTAPPAVPVEAAPAPPPAPIETAPVAAPPAPAAHAPAPSSAPAEDTDDTDDTEDADRTPSAPASTRRPSKRTAPASPTRPAVRATRTGRASRVAVAAPPEPESVITPDDEQPATARARTAYNAGNQALFAGDTEGAVRGYRQALNAAPTFPPGFRGLGLAYAMQGNDGPAIMAFRTYISLAPHAKDVPLIKKRIAALATHH
jgi:hypothetical protein